MALSTDDRRQARRFQTRHPAKIVLGPEAMISCMVKDISTGGAKIVVRSHVDLPETFELFIAAHDLQTRQVRVCWRDGDCAGVAFSFDESRTAPVADAPRKFPFEACLKQVAKSPKVTPPLARKQLNLYRTTV